MFKENYIITGKIECESGLHIGGSGDIVDIGGSDNPIIRDSVSRLPYIPGSSLKGKLRSLLEINDKKSTESIIKNGGKVCNDDEAIASRIFGVSSDEHSSDEQNKQKFSTRIIVRDSFPTDESIKLWERQEEVVGGAELKYENTINRINSSAMPRNMERVPKGSNFNFEIIFSVYEEDEEDLLKGVFESMLLLEDNYLGGSGSRGSGKVKFKDICVIKRDKDYYKEAKEEEFIIENGNISEVIKAIEDKDKDIKVIEANSSS